MGTIRLKVKTIPVTIDTGYIRLDSLLKLAGAVNTGGQAKFEIQSGTVTLDGEVCRMRGKKVSGGQRVTYGGKTYQVIAAGGMPVPGKTDGKEQASPPVKEQKSPVQTGKSVKKQKKKSHANLPLSSANERESGAKTPFSKRAYERRISSDRGRGRDKP